MVCVSTAGEELVHQLFLETHMNSRGPSGISTETQTDTGKKNTLRLAQMDLLSTGSAAEKKTDFHLRHNFKGNDEILFTH